MTGGELQLRFYSGSNLTEKKTENTTKKNIKITINRICNYFLKQVK